MLSSTFFSFKESRASDGNSRLSLDACEDDVHQVDVWNFIRRLFYRNKGLCWQKTLDLGRAGRESVSLTRLQAHDTERAICFERSLLNAITQARNYLTISDWLTAQTLNLAIGAECSALAYYQFDCVVLVSNFNCLSASSEAVLLLDCVQIVLLGLNFREDDHAVCISLIF